MMGSPVAEMFTRLNTVNRPTGIGVVAFFRAEEDNHRAVSRIAIPIIGVVTMIGVTFFFAPGVFRRSYAYDQYLWAATNGLSNTINDP
jgi:hypothetical protein